MIRWYDKELSGICVGRLFVRILVFSFVNEIDEMVYGMLIKVLCCVIVFI